MEDNGYKPTVGDPVWVPSGTGWRPGIVKSTPPDGFVYCQSWTQRGMVPASTKPPAKTQTSKREPWSVKPRDVKGERPKETSATGEPIQ